VIVSLDNDAGADESARRRTSLVENALKPGRHAVSVPRVSAPRGQAIPCNTVRHHAKHDQARPATHGSMYIALRTQVVDMVWTDRHPNGYELRNMA
jgi:hypothetical protein